MIGYFSYIHRVILGCQFSASRCLLCCCLDFSSSGFYIILHNGCNSSNSNQQFNQLEREKESRRIFHCFTPLLLASCWPEFSHVTKTRFKGTYKYKLYLLSSKLRREGRMDIGINDLF